MSNLTLETENVINKMHARYFTFILPFMASIKCTPEMYSSLEKCCPQIVLAEKQV